MHSNVKKSKEYLKGNIKSHRKIATNELHSTANIIGGGEASQHIYENIIRTKSRSKKKISAEGSREVLTDEKHFKQYSNNY